MSIAFSCEKCGRGLRVNPNLAGKRIKCPDCKSVLTVPAESVESSEPPERAAPAVPPVPPAPPVPASPSAPVSPPAPVAPVPSTPASPVTSASPAAPTTSAARTARRTAAAAAPSSPPSTPQVAPKPPHAPSSQSTHEPPAAPSRPGPVPEKPQRPAPPPPASKRELWYVTTDDEQSYGPVDREDLDAWVGEGRLNRDCQLLRDGDEQWQWADAVYPELAEGEAAAAEGSVDEGSDEDALETNKQAAEPKSTSSKVAREAKPSATSKTASKRVERPRDDGESHDDSMISDRSRITAGLLGIFLGPLGLHRIYLGYVLIGLLMLATGGGCGIWSMIDAIRVLLGQVPDASGKTLRV